MHSFNIRYKDKTGQWSSVLTQYVQRTNKPLVEINNKVIEYRYWFDRNYGPGGMRYSRDSLFKPVQYYYFQPSPIHPDVTPGTHDFYIQFRDSTGQWCSVINYQFIQQQYFVKNKIIAYEYWFDNGYIKNRNYRKCTPYQKYLQINNAYLKALNSGMHSFNIRFQDSTKLWSSVVTQYFQIVKQPLQVNNKIVEYRYWFDKNFKDVIYGAVSPTVKYYDLNIPIPANITPGNHIINFQFRDSIQQWSIVLLPNLFRKSIILLRLIIRSLNTDIGLIKIIKMLYMVLYHHLLNTMFMKFLYKLILRRVFI